MEVQRRLSESLNNVFKGWVQEGEILNDKLFRRFVSENTYQKIKELGPYTEKNIKGVKVLTEHSSKKMEKFIVIETPKFLQSIGE